MATTPIIFSLIDSKNSCFYSRIYISPISYPLVYSGSIVVGDAVATITNDRSPIVTVNLIPNQYECRCIGQDNTYETQFYISVPSSSTPVSASAILYNIQNFAANTTASYAISSSYATTASYALNGGGGGSGVWTDAGTYIVNNNVGYVSASYIETPTIQANSVILPSQNPEYVLATNDTYEVVSTTTTPTQLEYINNVTSDIQQQLNNKYESGSATGSFVGDFIVAGNQPNIYINTYPSNSYGRMVFKDSGSERVAIQFLNNQFDAYYTTSGRSNALEIYNNTGSTIFFNSGSERMRITKDGSILINKPGVTSSAYKVEVNGGYSGSTVCATQLLANTTASGGGAIQCNGALYMGVSNNSGLRNYSGETNLQLYGYYNVNVAGQAGAQYSQATVFDVNGNVAIGVPARSTSGAMTTGRFYVSASNGTDHLITANNGAYDSFIVNPNGSVELDNGRQATLIGSGISNVGDNSGSVVIGLQANGNGGTRYNAESVTIGKYTGYNSTYATQSVQIGRGAGYNSISASYAVQIGYAAGYSSTTASNAVQIGNSAGIYATNAEQAVQIGRNAGGNSTTAVYAVQIGSTPGFYTTNADYCVQIGGGAGYTSSNAYQAVQVGYNAGYSSSYAYRAVQIGPYAGRSSTTADYAVQIGYGSGYNATTSSNAVQIGNQAGFNAFNSTYSTMVGHNAGYNNNTGSNNTFIGSFTDIVTATNNVTKSIAIGYNAKVSASNQCVIGGTGVDAVNVGIGTANPSHTLSVVGTVSASAYSASNAGFYCPGNTADSGIKCGSYEIQGFGLNNAWFGENVYYNGSAFKARNTGYISMVYNQSPEIQYRISSTSITAGATWSPTVIAKLYGVTNTCAFGGSLTTTAGNFTNAVLLVSGSGLVGVNNVNPATALDVTGTTRTTAFVTPQSLPATLYTGSTYYSASFLYIYNGAAWRSASLS